MTLSNYIITRIEGSRVWAREVNNHGLLRPIIDDPDPTSQYYAAQVYEEFLWAMAESSLREFEVAQECLVDWIYSSTDILGEQAPAWCPIKLEFTPGQPITGSIEQREGKEYVIVKNL